MGQFDFIICGRQTLDGDTGQVAPELAEVLKLPFVAYVSKIEEINEKMIRVQRLVEEGHEIIEAPLPAVITVVKEINVPRLPSLRRLSKAKNATIPTWTYEDLGINKDKTGMAGSATKVVKVFVPPRAGKGELLTGETEDQVDSLITRLRGQNIV